MSNQGHDDVRRHFRRRAGCGFALRTAERRYGDGFFNAVFVEWVRGSSFAEVDPIRELLPHVHANRPYRGNGSSYDECRELVQTAIRGRALELTENLQYSRNDGQRILAAALAQYLDERVSVSIGRVLGWT